MIEDRTRIRDEIFKTIHTEQNNILNYLDTFDLPTIVKFKTLTMLMNARVKKYAKKKNSVISSLQSFITRKNLFIKQSEHDENIEIAFLNNDYINIILLWCDKHNNSYSSLDELFPALEFFIEERTIEFIKKYSFMANVFHHIGCMYSIQIIISQGLIDKSLSMYTKDLLKKGNLDKIRILLLKTKNVFKQFMLYVYRNCFHRLSDDILEIIIDYNYLNYTIL